tara:strand:- start:3199 stop:3735 length:537 start_codon:yes stop_codon:yes gene_type:complete
MAAVWPVFQSQLVQYLKKKKAKKDDETAEKIGNLYHKAVKTAMPLLVPGALPMAGSAAPVINGFKASFKLGRKLKGKKPTPAIWAPAASGIVLYWTGKTFQPAIPAPGGVPPATTHITTFPGAPPAAQIYAAMKGKTPEAVAAGLVGAFTTHLASVSGLWTGFTPVGAPLPFPWVGIA